MVAAYMEDTDKRERRERGPGELPGAFCEKRSFPDKGVCGWLIKPYRVLIILSVIINKLP